MPHPSVLNQTAISTKLSDFKKYLVAGSQSIAHGVKVTANSKITYDSKGFKFIKLCSHSVAVTEKEDVLNRPLFPVVDELIFKRVFEKAENFVRVFEKLFFFVRIFDKLENFVRVFEFGIGGYEKSDK